MNKLKVIKFLSMVLLVSSNVFGTNFVVQNKTNQTIYFLLDFSGVAGGLASLFGVSDIGAKLEPMEFIDTHIDLKEQRSGAALAGIKITLNEKDVVYTDAKKEKIKEIKNALNFSFDTSIIGDGGIDFCGTINVVNSSGQKLTNLSTQLSDEKPKYLLNIAAIVLPDAINHQKFKKKLGGFGPFAIYFKSDKYLTIDQISSQSKKLRGKQREINDPDLANICSTKNEPLIPLLGNEID